MIESIAHRCPKAAAVNHTVAKKLAAGDEASQLIAEQLPMR